MTTLGLATALRSVSIGTLYGAAAEATVAADATAADATAAADPAMKMARAMCTGGTRGTKAR
jgi:hypothetical protein